VIEIFDFAQYSPEWWAIRMGIPTISEFSSILAKGEGKTRRKYMLQLAGERITGEPADNFVTAHMERGRIMEAEAREHYMYDVLDVRPVGFIRRKTALGYVGGSPDSLVGADGMLEIKTKLPHLQLDVILQNRLPPEHVPQVQGGLWLTGRKWCDFVSYWPNLPLFRIRVTPDLEYHKQLEVSIDAFNKELNEIVKSIPPPNVRTEKRPLQVPNDFKPID
jgi:hypothetical protein